MKLHSGCIASEACPYLFASLAEVACWSSIFAGSLVNCWGRCKKCFWQTRAWHWPCTCWSDWISIEQSSHCRPTVCEGNGRAGVAMFFEALETLAYQASWEWPAKVSACQHSTSFVFVWRQFLLWLRAQIQSSSMHWSFVVTTSLCILHIECSCAFKAQPALHGAGGVTEASRYFDIFWNHVFIYYVFRLKSNLHCIWPAWLDSTRCAAMASELMHTGTIPLGFAIIKNA